MNKSDAVYLRHILDAINQIQEYVIEISYETFMATRLVQDGVIRQFEIIGEATKNLSEILRDSYTDIPWKDMAGMRDKLIHQYFGVDRGAVWDSINDDLPSLKSKIIKILPLIES
jgi:uncharacterized protein with HEPN domain